MDWENKGFSENSVRFLSPCIGERVFSPLLFMNNLE